MPGRVTEELGLELGFWGWAWLKHLPWGRRGGGEVWAEVRAQGYSQDGTQTLTLGQHPLEAALEFQPQSWSWAHSAPGNSHLEDFDGVGGASPGPLTSDSQPSSWPFHTVPTFVEMKFSGLGF